MKRICILFLSLLSCQIVFGQEFSFPIVFEDAIGNKDTLVLGFDVNATDTIDEDFSEINIIGIPLDSLFDVRVSDAFWKNGNGTFQTKKQIIPANSCTGSSVITIDFKCSNWPVTASWDNSVFDDTCREGSVLTSVHPGGWWDTGSHSDLWRAELKNVNEVTFTSNVIPGAYDENYAYINQAGDTIPVFWLAFGNAGLLWMDVDEIEQEGRPATYPNPFKTATTIAYELKSAANVQLIIYNHLGKQIEVIRQKQPSGKQELIWDATGYSSGVYYFRMRAGEQLASGKMLLTR